MTRVFLTVVLMLVFLGKSYSQIESIRPKIDSLVRGKNALVGVAITGIGEKDTLTVNGDKRFPMQSVFKFHIALTVLSEIDKGRFALNQKIKITQKDLLPDTWSPIRDQYPKGGELTIAQLIQYTVSQSDNVGCDVLLRLLGGPQMVEDYFIKNGFKDIAVKVNEEEMQKTWDAQFKNWTTPKASNAVLIAFYNNKKKLLSKESHEFIWKTMRETSTGKNRLKAQLPAGTVVAHKTGTSGTNDAGITSAVNDIGVVSLSHGKQFFISVFVTDSRENEATNERIIADIAKVVWDYYELGPGKSIER